MNRFAVNVKRNLRLFLVGLAGVKQNLQDVSHVKYVDPAVAYTKLRIVEEVTRYCEEHVRKENVNGMSIAITLNGKLMYKAGFGYKDAEKKIKADADMRGDVASISKLITAHLMMQLHERTDNNFDVFGSLYPFWPNINNRKIMVSLRTVRPYAYQPIYSFITTEYPRTEEMYVAWLLCHRTGIPHYGDFVLESEAALNCRFQSCTEAMQMYINKDLERWPGSSSYTSYGPNFAGAVIEQVTGQTFRDHAHDELHRWNMRNSIFPRSTKDVIFNHATGYQNHNHQHSMFIDLAYKYPSGGLVSTVGDLVKFGDIYLAIFQGLLDDNTPGKSPLKKSTLDMMWSNHDELLRPNFIGNQQVGYAFQCLGWVFKNMLFRLGGGDYFLTSLHHGGAASGFTSTFGTNYITRDDNTKNIKKVYRRTVMPQLPPGLQLCSCEELAQSSDISVDGLKGFTIAIIANKKNDTKLDDLYWKICKLFIDIPHQIMGRNLVEPI